MKRTIAPILCVLLVVVSATFASCTDDRVTLRRGPLGPASYEVRVRASQQTGQEAEVHRASLRVEPRPEGASFDLRTTEGEVLQALLHIADDGSVDLAGIRGTAVRSGQELASLVGQLNPPLPRSAVRLGKRWSSSQRITTRALSALLQTSLRIVRFTREASTDAAELAGEVRGLLRVTGPTRVSKGILSGETRIVWAVKAGRVVSADTNLVWNLGDGNRITLQTTVRPR